MGSLSDFNSAARLRDSITAIASQVVDQMNPLPRLGTVVAVNTTVRSATVQYPDDPGTFTISYGGITPSVGSIVRIVGQRGAKYIDDVLTGAVLPPLPQIITFTSNGAFVKATYLNLRGVRVTLQGGGGGGGGAQQTNTVEGALSGLTVGSVGGGGGGGCAVIKIIDVDDLASSEAITIGGGGIPSSVVDSPGGWGGNTTGFGMVAYGGQGGLCGGQRLANYLATVGGQGASGVGGGAPDLVWAGQHGAPGFGTEHRNSGGNGGASYLGQGGFGGNAMNEVGNNGGNGVRGGGGGGGANRPLQAADRTGGVGGPGVTVVELIF